MSLVKRLNSIILGEKEPVQLQKVAKKLELKPLEKKVLIKKAKPAVGFKQYGDKGYVPSNGKGVGP